MARSQMQGSRRQGLRGRVSAALLSAMGVLLIFASTSLSAFHGHEVAAPHNHEDRVSAFSDTGTATNSAANNKAPAVVAFSDEVDAPDESESDPINCDLCDLGLRGDADLALVPEQLSEILERASVARVLQPAPTLPRTFAAAGTGPRAPPSFSA